MDSRLRKLHEQIKSVRIQGATNVALTVAAGLRDLAERAHTKNRAQFIRQIAAAGQYLLSARATEPMADNAVEYILFRLRKEKGDAALTVRRAADDFERLIAANGRRITATGAKLVKRGDKIFTHCHASTVIDILKAAKAARLNFAVLQTETRPLFQGHRTAADLSRAGIKATLVVDSAAPYLISDFSGPDFQIDKVIIGCDAIARDGTCLNKVGSFSLALSAYLNNIPVYVATQSLKLNEDIARGRALKIETRSAREVWLAAPRGLKIYNPAFDLIPAEFITAYITEFGLVKPANLFAKVEKKYPWILG